MNSTIQTSTDEKAGKHSARIEFLKSRIAQLKQRALESGANDDLQVRLQCYEASLNELFTTGKTHESSAESDPHLAPEQLAAGQPPDKGRTGAGQTPDTDRPTSGQAPDNSPKLNPLEKEIVEELNDSSQSPLDKLPPNAQEQLFDLISRHPITTIHKIICLPSPHGWGLSTSRQSLYRFRDRYAEQKRREYRKQQKSVAKAIIEDLDGADEQFADASERLFKLRLLETANNPTSKTRDLRDLFTTLIRLRAISKRTPAKERSQSS
jgi:hypothetical protein